MISHNINSVIFASEADELITAVNKPRKLPFLQYSASEIRKKLESITEWKLESEAKASNQGAFLIADSVIQGNRFQSYVARGFPLWLQSVFDSESITD